MFYATRVGEDWYIDFDDISVEDFATVTAHFRVGGQWGTYPVDVTTYRSSPVLHLTTSLTGLPNGVEVLFYLDGTYKNSTAFRYPESGSLSMIVYR